MSDPRLTPARDDLAAKQLEGKVAAARFAEGIVYEVVAAQAPLRHAPAADAPLDSEALNGERVTIYEISEGWAWGQLQSDGYVGFLPETALAPPGPAPTHKVIALRTLLFPGPSIKLPPVGTLPLGARIAIERIEGTLAVTAAGAYVPACHLNPIDVPESDFVAVAERFLGTPYLWGGKTNFGIDCSGLVQVALNACGLPCPRDSDMQEQAFGKPIEVDETLSTPRRGDLLFWKGHVAIVRDAKTLLHANAFHMAATIEPIDKAVTRIRAGGSDIASARRL